MESARRLVFILYLISVSLSGFFYPENNCTRAIACSGVSFPKVSFVSQKPESVDVIFNILNEDDELIDGIIVFSDSSVSPIFVHDGNIKTFLRTGKYQFKVLAAECETLCREVEISKKGKNVFFFDMPDLKKRQDVLIKFSDMETGAEIFPCISLMNSDKEECIYSGMSSGEPFRLKDGEYAVRADLEGYYPEIMEVSVSGKNLALKSKMLPYKDSFIVAGVKPDKSKSELTTDEKAIAEDICSLLKCNPDLNVKIMVFTDDAGDSKTNLSTTNKKAENLKKYICSLGIDEKRLSAEGFGETMNIADNETAKGREKNRRVELKITRLKD